MRTNARPRVVPNKTDCTFHETRNPANTHTTIMARLSAENSVEHLAALKTPDQKGSRRTNRFKDFFKGGHSRANLSSGSNMSPPGVSPKGGVENFKPGFEKVGLHPSERSPGSEAFGSLPPERSRTLDLDEWEKLKEENKDLGHLAKMQLYKEREEMRKREDIEGDNKTKSPMRDILRDENEEAMELLNVEAGSAEAAMTADTVPTAGDKEAAAFPNLTQVHWHDYSEFETTEALGKEDSIRKACEGSSSESPSNVSANVGSTVLRQHSLRHSPPCE
ncbi:hypothetical protein SLS60_002465 [Paraconiothyrium brasiliense]|uniref:Uncharacterized protein n=1 Tax=Paraconiothyrium brasiliense TaxID=300254 RepID=A0ABR3S270_9PLEO